MPRHKQTPGISYRILSQDARQAVMEYTYLCPYCMRKSTVRSTVRPGLQPVRPDGRCTILENHESLRRD